MAEPPYSLGISRVVADTVPGIEFHWVDGGHFSPVSHPDRSTPSSPGLSTGSRTGGHPAGNIARTGKAKPPYATERQKRPSPGLNLAPPGKSVPSPGRHPPILTKFRSLPPFLRVAVLSFMILRPSKAPVPK